MSTTRKIIGLAAATSLGAYWLSGSEGRRRREALRGSLLKTKTNLLDKLERFGSANRETYRRLAEQASQRWATLKRINARELKELAADLREAWRSVEWNASAARSSGRAAPVAEEARGAEEREPAGF